MCREAQWPNTRSDERVDRLGCLLAVIAAKCVKMLHCEFEIVG